MRGNLKYPYMNMKLIQKTFGSIGLRAHQITQHIHCALIAS